MSRGRALSTWLGGSRLGLVVMALLVGVGAGLGADYQLPDLPANSADLARGILSAPQLSAFQRLIQAQAAQAQLRATSGS